MELMFEWEKGWIEIPNNVYPKVTQAVDFKAIPVAEIQGIARGPHYSRTGLVNPAIAAIMAKLLQVEISDLFDGNLRIGTAIPVEPGWYLEIRLNLPFYDCHLRFLARVIGVQESEEMKERVYSAGLHVVAVHKGDMAFFDHAVEARKAKH